MLVTLFAAAALAPAEPGTAPPAPPAETAAPAPPAKPVASAREICLTKVLSPKEKKSCCKNFPDLCSTPVPPPG